MRILVCDDRNPEDVRSAAIEGLQNAGMSYEVVALTVEELGVAVRDLFATVSKWLDDDAEFPSAPMFDGYDLLLLDHGLTAIKTVGGRLTADQLIGYLRAFTNTNYIVSLNRLNTTQGNVDFDLKFLMGDAEAQADQALSTDHLRIGGLWSGAPMPGTFCPWYWPSLSNAPSRRREQIRIVLENLDRPVLEVLNLPPEIVDQIPRRAVAFLSPAASGASEAVREVDARSVTFWQQFLGSNRTLPPDDRKSLAKMGTGATDSTHAPALDQVRETVARVVAGELEYWFRREIIGPQRLLVDAAHLQAKFGVRTDNSNGDPSIWTRTATDVAPPYGLDPALGAMLDKVAYVSPWLERPSFWRPIIEKEPLVEELIESANVRPDLVFCEDTRDFRSRASDTPPQRFVTELGRGVDVRHVAKLSGYQYSPASLFAR